MKQCPHCENEIGFFKGLKKLKSKRVAFIFKKANENYLCINCGVVLQRKWSQLTLVTIGFLFSGYTTMINHASYSLLLVTGVFSTILFILIAVAIKNVSYEEIASKRNDNLLDNDDLKK